MNKLVITLCLFLGTLIICSAQMPDIDMPEIKETTDEPVLLRNKFTAGDEYNIISITAMSTVTRMANDKESAEKSIITGYYSVLTDSVDKNGIGKLIATITRMKQAHEGMSGNNELDTDIPGSPGSKAQSLFLNKQLLYTFNTLGEVQERDLSALIESLKEGGQAAVAELFEKADASFMDFVIVRLPEAPVKQGDTHSFGIFSQSIAGMINAEIDLKYDIEAVSKDKKQVLIKQYGDSEIILDELYAGLKITSENYSGWILFDIQKGRIIESFLSMTMKMQIGESISNVVIDIKYMIE